MTALAALFITKPPADSQQLRAQTRSLLSGIQGRGQDDDCLWQQGPICMAARLRRTQDLTPDGLQPATSPDGAFTVFIDGFIANANALRHELEDAGLTFQGHADAEILAIGSMHWGLNRLLQKIMGAYALLIWDEAAQALHLVCDRVGARPIYVAKLENGFAVASDLNAFKKLTAFNATLNHGAVQHVLAWGYSEPSACLWHGVTRVPAAHRLLLESTTQDTPKPELYWSAATTLEEIALRDLADSRTYTNLDEATLEICKESVRLDVAFCLLDDGGPASAQLLRSIEHVTQKNVKTSTLPMADGAAVQMAFDALTKLGEPVCDPRAIAWYLAFKKTNAEAPVCFMASTLERRQEIQKPPLLHRVIAHVPTIFQSFVPKSLQHLLDHAPDLYLAQNTYWQNFTTWPDLNEPRLECSIQSKSSYYDFVLNMTQNLNPSLDRIANAAGVELRIPLIDTRLLPFGWPTLPTPGYTDIAVWLRGPLRPRIQNLLTPKNLAHLGLKDTTALTNSWTDFLNGDDTQTRKIWMLSLLLAWLAQHCSQ